MCSFVQVKILTILLVIAAAAAQAISPEDGEGGAVDGQGASRSLLGGRGWWNHHRHHDHDHHHHNWCENCNGGTALSDSSQAKCAKWCPSENQAWCDANCVEIPSIPFDADATRCVRHCPIITVEGWMCMPSYINQPVGLSGTCTEDHIGLDEHGMSISKWNAHLSPLTDVIEECSKICDGFNVPFATIETSTWEDNGRRTCKCTETCTFAPERSNSPAVVYGREGAAVTPASR